MSMPRLALSIPQLATIAALSGEGMPTVGLSYAVVDTGQTTCYNSNGTAISCPSEGNPFYGQDAQFAGENFDYTAGGDGTVKRRQCHRLNLAAITGY